MPDEYTRRPTLPGQIPRSDAEALWQTLHADRARVHARFDKQDKELEQLSSDMGDVKGSLAGIERAEEERAKSTEKRNGRIWQIVSALLVAFLIFLGGVVAKVFLPAAAASVQSKPDTVLEKLDKVRDTLEAAPHGGQ